MKMLHRFFILLFCLPLTACDFGNSLSRNHFLTNDKITIDSIRQQNFEAQLGAAEHPKLLENYGGIYDFEKLENLLASILGRLVASLSGQPPAFSINVLDSPNINAFALPGGYLYITRGLIALANDESELAAVIAHEIAHVQNSDGVKRNKQARNLSIVERVVNEVVSNELAGKLAKANAQQKLFVFSKQQELKADRQAIDILAAAKFDVRAAARLLTSMQQFASWKIDSGQNNSSENDIYNYHPSTPQRIKQARSHAKKYNNNEIIHEYSNEEFLQKLNGIAFGEKINNGIVENNRYSHLNFNVTFETPKQFELLNRNKAIVAIGKNEEALRFDILPKPKEFTTTQAYINSGWVHGLQPQTIRSVFINSMPAAIANSVNDKWQFIIAVVEKNNHYFRFVFAAPKKNNQIENSFNEIIATFRHLSQYERNNITANQIILHTISSQNELDDLLNNRSNIPNYRQLFDVLNGIDNGRQLQLGDMVKIIL